MDLSHVVRLTPPALDVCRRRIQQTLLQAMIAAYRSEEGLAGRAARSD